MVEKDFFDCGTGSFYNWRVLKTNEIPAGRWLQAFQG